MGNSLIPFRRSAKPVREGNSIADAERFGIVEIGHTLFTGKRQVRIEMGKWQKMSCHVWGEGRTIEDACAEAIKKARMVEQYFPHPDEC